jgi:hypothetical protein
MQQSEEAMAQREHEQPHPSPPQPIPPQPEQPEPDDDEDNGDDGDSDKEKENARRSKSQQGCDFQNGIVLQSNAEFVGAECNRARSSVQNFARNIFSLRSPVQPVGGVTYSAFARKLVSSL